MINDLHFRIVAMTAVSVAGGVPVTFVSIVSVRCRGTASVGLMYFYSIFSFYNIYNIKQIKSTVSAYHNRVSVRNISEQMTEPVWFVMDIVSSISGWGAASDEGNNLKKRKMRKTEIL